MTFDEDGDDDARPGPPLPPEDRLWRHPSELGGAPPPATPDPSGESAESPPGRGRVATVSLVIGSGAIGAVAALAVLVMLGALDDEPPPAEVIEKVEAQAADADQLAAAEEAMVAVVRLEIVTDDHTVPGTGLVIRDDGHVLTTADLVSDAQQVTAVFVDGSTAPAQLVGSDRSTDLAVVKVEGEELESLVLGSAADLEEGERILAISSPTADADAATVTRGVVHRLGTRLDTVDGTLHDLIQTSRTVGDLSAGSALLDQGGSLVGIVTDRDPLPEESADEDTTDTAGEGDPDRAPGPYATPIEFARHVAEEIIETGQAQHPWLGVEGSDVPDVEQEPDGALVHDVVKGSPAEQAGLASGDIINALDGEPVRSMTDFVVALREHEAGETVTIQYRREEADATCQPTLEEWQPRA